MPTKRYKPEQIVPVGDLHFNLPQQCYAGHLHCHQVCCP
jgi:hypothetical protein